VLPRMLALTLATSSWKFPALALIAPNKFEFYIREYLNNDP